MRHGGQATCLNSSLEFSTGCLIFFSFLDNEVVYSVNRFQTVSHFLVSDSKESS